MAASSAVTNTGLTGLRRNVLNKWVEYLSCTVSELGLKNPQTGILGPGRNEPHTLQGVHPSERQCSTSLSLSRVSTPTTLLLRLNLPGSLAHSYSTHCDLISRAKKQD